MKKYILISRGIIIFPAVALVMLAANAKVSDFTEEGSADDSLTFEGGNQNRMMRKNEFVMDSGAVKDLDITK